jgi:hypothetical protein
MVDDYRGETFRRARSGAEIIVACNAPNQSEVVLLVEPLAGISEDGTHLPGGPTEVRVSDSGGKVVASFQAAGLTRRQITLPRAAASTEPHGKLKHAPPTQVFRLEFEGAPELKLYHCGWIGPGRASGPGLAQPWGAGWKWNATAGAMQSTGRAELVITASEQGAGPLFLDLETTRPNVFEISNADDQLLATFYAETGRAVHRLDLDVAAGRTHVVTLIGSGPFQAWRCDWTESPRQETPSGPVFLHTNACGDFTLLSRRQWFDLRAYPEFDLFSMNLDSIFCATAHFGGAREEMLEEPMRIYHIEHGSGSGWTPEGQAKLFERIAAKGLKFVDNEEVLMWTAQMGKLAAPMIFNHEDWGLDGIDLPETVIQTAGPRPE